MSALNSVGDADAYTDIKETLVSSGYTIEFSEVVMLAKVQFRYSRGFGKY